MITLLSKRNRVITNNTSKFLQPDEKGSKVGQLGQIENMRIIIIFSIDILWGGDVFCVLYTVRVNLNNRGDSLTFVNVGLTGLRFDCFCTSLNNLLFLELFKSLRAIWFTIESLSTLSNTIAEC